MTVDLHPPPRTIVLDGGTAVRLRPIRSDDEPRLIALYDRLSEHSAYQRFFTLMPRLPRDRAHRLANLDDATRFALVLEREDRDELLGVAAAHGIAQFRASVLGDNRRMLTLLNRHTHVRRRTLDAGVVEVLFERRV